MAISRISRIALTATTSITALFVGVAGAYAQEGAAAAAVDPADIVVTARKRQESLQNVPVIAQVVTADTLNRRQTIDLKGLTQLTPSLMVGSGTTTIGNQIAIRGVGTTAANPGVDQSVSMNIDGLPIGQGLAFVSGMFDVGQIEVLEGPQALFFGKSSPGGVISLRTADPTDKFEVIGRFGYEAEAHTRRGELILSGPLSSTLKVRLAGMYQKSDGFFYNDAEVPASLAAFGAITPRYDRLNNSENYQIRGTVLWNPASNFDARLKVNLVHDHSVNGDNARLVSCPEGVSSPAGIPFIDPRETCSVKSRTAYTADMSPANFPGVLNGGTPFTTARQYYGTLELNYHPADEVTLTSVTGYYDLKSSALSNVSWTSMAGPLLAYQVPDFSRKDFTQELRLTTDYAMPLNFTLGAFYQDGKMHQRVQFIGNTAFIPQPSAAAIAPLGLTPPLPYQDGYNPIKIKTYSVFGQARYKITPELEFAAGIRWTDELRTETPLVYPSLASLKPTPVAIPLPVTRLHSSPATPEITLTYRPNSDLTIFAAYKQGAKSGSFNIPSPIAANVDNSFGDEKVKGGEFGIKGRLADRQIHFALSGYRYIYSDLQVGTVDVTTGLPLIRTFNAAKGKVYGIEANATYRPAQIAGLSFDGAVNWNHARFTSFPAAPCQGGQTIAMGCNGSLNTTTGLYQSQDLTGFPFVRAPDWQVNFGFQYELPLGNGMRLTLANGNHYSSSYWTGTASSRDYVQSAFLKSDVSLSLAGKDNRWEVALIGNNVGNKLVKGACTGANYASGLLVPSITGGTTSGASGLDELYCRTDPGRELWLRLTIRPFG
ncbi:hypothetical protein BH10PSE12_BH10PSE12_23130 [soil metagenome]